MNGLNKLDCLPLVSLSAKFNIWKLRIKLSVVSTQSQGPSRSLLEEAAVGTEARLLNKSLCLATDLGITKFTNVLSYFGNTKSDFNVQQSPVEFLV